MAILSSPWAGTVAIVCSFCYMPSFANAQAISVFWTTDDGTSPITSPDGPWQALSDIIARSAITDLVLWPGIGIDYGLLPKSNVNWSLADPSVYWEDSPDGSDTLLNATTTLDDADLGPIDGDTTGCAVISEEIYLHGIYGESSNPINASFCLYDERVETYPDGTTFQHDIGYLGLGYVDARPAYSYVNHMYVNGSIGSQTYGLHLGTAAFNQQASLVLGGYEQNHLVGPVSTFHTSQVFLIDVVLGVEIGSSPFSSGPGGSSVYRGLGDNEDAITATRAMGGRDNAALIQFQATVPYMYLPEGTCEAAAEQLPVTWSDAQQLYLWNTDDPQYLRIVRSPAYLAFVFEDSVGANLTVKVPFAVLDLNLTSPLVDKPTPFLPCRSSDGTFGIFTLGRAFLQAAFLAHDLEAGTYFLAQGPGPHMGSSVVRELVHNGSAPEPDQYRDFENTWSESWTVLTDDDGSSSNDAVSSAEGGGSTTALSTAAKAGIAVGSIVGGLLIIGGGLWVWWRRRRRRQQTPKSELEQQHSNPTSTGGGIGELPEDRKPLEAPAGALAHELPAPRPVLEAPTTTTTMGPASELP